MKDYIFTVLRDTLIMQKLEVKILTSFEFTLQEFCHHNLPFPSMVPTPVTVRPLTALNKIQCLMVASIQYDLFGGATKVPSIWNLAAHHMRSLF